MKIMKENKLVIGSLEKWRYFIRPFLDNGSSVTQIERQVGYDLLPIKFKINK
jgi:hypothetical protein